MRMADSNPNDNDTITINFSNDLGLEPISIDTNKHSTYESWYNDYTSNMADSFTYGTDTITVTANTSDTLDTIVTGSSWNLDDIITNPTKITIGNTELTEPDIKKIQTIIEMFESDEELSKILQAQMALNKLKD